MSYVEDQWVVVGVWLSASWPFVSGLRVYGGFEDQAQAHDWRDESRWFKGFIARSRSAA